MYGMEREYYAEEHGYNSRLDEVHAGILLTKLPHLDGYVERRQELAHQYDVQLAGLGLVLPETDDGNGHAFYLYVARHPRRDEIIAELAQRGVNVNVSYRYPIHTMRAYQHFGYHDGDLPNTEAAMNEIFSLPMYPSLTDEDQRTVSAALHEILAKIG